MTTRAEIEGEMGDSHVGQLARLMSQGLRKLTSVIAKSNTTAIFINQIREKIGVMYGNPETTPGGRALKFYASVRIEVRRGEQIKDGASVVGNRTRCKVVKNKVAPPFKEAEFDIMYGKGISKVGEILDIGVEFGIIKKGGAWFSYNDMKLGQGRDNSKQFLLDNPEIMDEIEGLIRDKFAQMNAEALHPPKKQESSKLEKMANASAGIKAPAKAESKVDVLADPEEDFEEFVPVDIADLGN